MKDTSNSRRVSHLSQRERVRVRAKLTKRQIEVTLFAAGVGILEGLKVGKLVDKGNNSDG